MKVNQNFIILDVETGGFNPEQNLLTQIGFIVVDGFTMQEKFKYNSYIYPYDEQHYLSSQASQLTGITKEKLIAEGKPLKIVLDEVSGIFKQFKTSYYLPVLVGHNVSFDQMFLEYVFDYVYGSKTGKNGVCKLYDFILKSSIDTMVLARQKFVNDELPNFKLETIGDYLGFTNSNAHDAFADVEQTLQLFIYFMNCFRNQTTEVQTVAKKEFKFQF